MAMRPQIMVPSPIFTPSSTWAPDPITTLSPASTPEPTWAPSTTQLFDPRVLRCPKRLFAQTVESSPI